MSSSKTGAAAVPALGHPVSALAERQTHSRSADSVSTSNGAVESAILDEQTFTKMLCLERKRTERSGRPFVLMLLESGTLARSTAHHPAFQTFVRTLSQSTRETDVKGWYKEGSIFGVI